MHVRRVDLRWFHHSPSNRGIYAISHIWRIWWFFGWKYEGLELSKELSFGLNLFWSEYWPWFWSKYQTLVFGLVTVLLLISLVWMNSHNFDDYCPWSVEVVVFKFPHPADVYLDILPALLLLAGCWGKLLLALQVSKGHDPSHPSS